MQKLVTSDNYHAHTKHIEKRYHFMHEAIANNTLKLVDCDTNDMLADMFTKALPSWKVTTHIAALGLHPLNP